MLNKILRYDFKAILKYWWIGAVLAVIISFATTPLLRFFNDDTVKPMTVFIAGFGIVFSIICISAFLIVSEILIFAHFYKNLFTDQGYLTFTLPVKRTTLLNSKLLSGSILMIITEIIFVLVIAYPVINGLLYDSFKPEGFWHELFRLAKEVWEMSGGYIIVYAIEAVILLVLGVVSSVLVMYICITIGAVIAKKMKLLASIGVYYAANNVMGVVGVIFSLAVVPSLSTVFSNIEEDWKFCVMGGLIITALLLVCTCLYTLELWLVDKKLNLA